MRKSMQGCTRAARTWSAPSRAVPVSSPAPTATYALPFCPGLWVPTFVSAMCRSRKPNVARRRVITELHGGT